MTTAWTGFIVLLTVLSLIGCGWLLWWTARRRPGDPAPEDTSHLWDEDLTEYNKPLPRWWINLFWITIAFSVAYLAWFGGLGGIRGTSGWSSAQEHARDTEANLARINEALAEYGGKPIDVLARDPRALAVGQSVFAHQCSTCHGSSARGAVGYPDLTDTAWHWGGTPERVLESVRDGRQGQMPAWGDVLTGIAGENGVDYMVAYVRSLSDPRGQRNNYLAAQGKTLYASTCAGCHGSDGRGNPAMGAPDLTDDAWLYGSSTAAIRESIANGRHGVMPAHGELLGDTRARLVAAYVWSLGGGQAEAQATAAAPAHADATTTAGAAAPAPAAAAAPDAAP